MTHEEIAVQYRITALKMAMDLAGVGYDPRPTVKFVLAVASCINGFIVDGLVPNAEQEEV